VRKARPDFPPSPALHQRLAGAYAATGQYQEAWTGYATAAEGFVTVGNLRGARESLEGARSFAEFKLTAAQKARLNDIDRSIAALERP
jgi:hypothetical protein